MTSWTTFLEQQGACDIDTTTQAIHRFKQVDASTDAPSTNFLVPLTDFGLITATGDDAASFLHNQLTNDVDHLSLQEARLAGYCTPKGRLLASLLIWRSEDTIFLQLPREIQPSILKRLQMFVLRSKVKLNEPTSQLVQIGLIGNAASTVLTQWFPNLPVTAYGKTDTPAGTLIRLTDTKSIAGSTAKEEARYIWIGDAHIIQEAWPQLTKALQPTATSYWRLGEIGAGIPTITAATQEQFVPQMINFERIGGVNFRKGCYPGQEIVARSQYLGKLKRRMLPFTVSSTSVAAGMEVFSSADPHQACGMIVNATPLTKADSAGLVELKLAASESIVCLGSADGPRLVFHKLPYLLEDPGADL
jgi:folate-binding protein YgfZ